MTSNRNYKYTFCNVRLEIWISLFLVISIFCVYWQVRNFSFVNFDDRQYITCNYYVQAGLTFESIRWSFTAAHANNWHPLTWLSHMLDSQIYGMNPGHHHMTNVLFHILNAVLLFLVLKKMTGALWKSAFVAAIFALHPLHVESVAWVAERKDVLSTFFWMMTVWSYTRYVENSRLDKYMLLILFYILGLMAKPMLVTLPFVLLLLDYWPLKRFQLNPSDSENQAIQRSFYFGLILEKIPVFFLSAASSIVTYLVQKSSGAVNSLSAIPFHVRIANALVSYISYIGKMLWPANLAVLYPYQNVILPWKVFSAGLLLMMISVFAFRMLRLKPYLSVGWLWYIGTLVPVIGIVQVGSQAMADRYTYVPLIGIFIMIVWGVDDLAQRWRFRTIGFSVVSAAIITIFMITSWLQVGYWFNSITLFEHAINVTGCNSTAQLNLGEALAEQNKFDDAIKHYYEAVRIKPGYAKVYNNLGKIYSNRKDPEKAIFHYNKALQFDPGMVQALYHLSWILSTHEDEKYRNGKEAVKLASILCKITQNRQPLSLDALAAAYAETGKFNDGCSLLKMPIKWL